MRNLTYDGGVRGPLLEGVSERSERGVEPDARSLLC